MENHKIFCQCDAFPLWKLAPVVKMNIFASLGAFSLTYRRGLQVGTQEWMSQAVQCDMSGYVWLSSTQCQVGPGALKFQREEPERNTLERGVSQSNHASRTESLSLVASGMEWDFCCRCGMNHCQTGAGGRQAFIVFAPPIPLLLR